MPSPVVRGAIFEADHDSRPDSRAILSRGASRRGHRGVRSTKGGPRDRGSPSSRTLPRTARFPVPCVLASQACARPSDCGVFLRRGARTAPFRATSEKFTSSASDSDAADGEFEDAGSHPAIPSDVRLDGLAPVGSEKGPGGIGPVLSREVKVMEDPVDVELRSGVLRRRGIQGECPCDLKGTGRCSTFRPFASGLF